MSGLRQICLGRHAKIISGFAFKSGDFVYDGVPIIKIGNIKIGDVSFDDSNTQYLQEYFVGKVDKKFHVNMGDILISLTGSHMTQPNSVVGRVARYNHKHLSLLNQRAGKIIDLDKDTLDQDFLYYFLSTKEIRQEIALLAHGAANQANVSPKDVEKLKLNVPSVKEQKKIAAILSAYDGLIENNKRRIALLEKMAEEIYREWFVRFRFPGYQNAEFKKGIPEGWDVCSLSDLAEINVSSLKKVDQIPVLEYIDIGSVTTNTLGDTTIYHGSEAPGRAKRKVKHGDIIWSSVRPANRAYCLIFNPPDNLIVSTGFAVISAKNIELYPFIYQAVTTNGYVDQITAVAKGAAYPATSFDDFEKSKILYPNDLLIKKYFSLSEPLYREMHLLELQNKKLCNMKDMLLPRLISGKLSVENLDIQFPPSMHEEVA